VTRRDAAAGSAALLFAIAAAAAALPEWRTARAKRRLLEGEALVIDASRQTNPAAREAILRDATEVLEGVSPNLPDDVRPEYLLGSASLLAGKAAVALDHYRRSLAIEERPETDMNLSRAYAAESRPVPASWDALRAVWLAPDLAKTLPPDTRKAVEKVVNRRAKRFSAGRARVPPLFPEPSIRR
jgi:hypothetical protein